MTIRKALSVVLIVFGGAVFVSLTAFDTLHSYRQWIIDDMGKAEEFPTFIEYWWNFNKGTTILSFLLGAIPAFIGVRIRTK